MNGNLLRCTGDFLSGNSFHEKSLSGGIDVGDFAFYSGKVAANNADSVAGPDGN
jgi:hypothetical protein